MRKASLNILFFSVAVLLTSCVGEFKEVSVSRIDGFKVTKISPSGIDGEISVTINNPNSTSFKVYRSKATIYYGDMKLGTAHTTKKVKIKANSNAPSTFVLKGDLKDVSFAQLPSILGKGAKMEIKGDIKAGKWFYKKKFPIDEKQRISGVDLQGGLPGFN
ncbi:MAG: LEA type 2 family protein [Bacteroidia bacterium]